MQQNALGNFILLLTLQYLNKHQLCWCSRTCSGESLDVFCITFHFVSVTTGTMESCDFNPFIPFGYSSKRFCTVKVGEKTRKSYCILMLNFSFGRVCFRKKPMTWHWAVTAAMNVHSDSQIRYFRANLLQHNRSVE